MSDNVTADLDAAIRSASKKTNPPPPPTTGSNAVRPGDASLLPLRARITRMEQDLEYLKRSETVRYYLRTDANGQRVNDIAALDRGIRELHARCRKAENEAQSCRAEAVYYRRKTEALEMQRKEDEENRFPLFQSDRRADEDQHEKA